jgi:hypothetical protein
MSFEIANREQGHRRECISGCTQDDSRFFEQGRSEPFGIVR